MIFAYLHQQYEHECVVNAYIIQNYNEKMEYTWNQYLYFLQILSFMELYLHLIYDKNCQFDSTFTFIIIIIFIINYIYFYLILFNDQIYSIYFIFYINYINRMNYLNYYVYFFIFFLIYYYMEYLLFVNELIISGMEVYYKDHYYYYSYNYCHLAQYRLFVHNPIYHPA